MQLVDTPPDSEREQTRRRPTRRTRVAAVEPETQAATPLPLKRTTRRARTTIGERAPEQTVSGEATPPTEAASESAPKRRRTRKTDATTEPVAAVAEQAVAAEAQPVAATAEQSVAAPKRRRATKAVAAATPEPAAATETAVANEPAAVTAQAITETAPKRRRTSKSAAAATEPAAPITTAAATTETTEPGTAAASDTTSTAEAAPKRRTRKSTPAAAAAQTVAAEAPAAVAQPAAETTPVAEPKRRTRKKIETTVEPEHPVTVDVAPASTTPEPAPKRRRARKADAVAPAGTAAPAPAVAEAAPAAAEPAPAPARRRRTRQGVAAAEAASTPAETPGEAPANVTVPAPASSAAGAQAEAPAAEAPATVSAEASASSATETPAAEDELPADFVPTITRVRIGRRGERKVTSERVLEPGELRRRRRERRERLAAEMAAGTPSPLAAPTQYVEAFGGLMLSAQTAQALAEMKYEKPTEIQAKAIPLLLEGKDVVGQAQTGTGKTAAFGIPLVERIDPSMLVVQALVLAPTRELASQIAQELGKIGRRRGLQVAAIYGGASMGAQLSALKRGAQVVVGTPGRILDHLKRGTLSFESVSYLVLDEADRMLDMGFMPDVERILRRTPRSRQTALFSATVPTVVRIISRRHMRDAVTVQVKPEQQTVTAIDQIFYEVAERDKPEALETVLREQQPERAMIFCRTQIAVDRLTRILRRDGFAVEAIHGSLGQGQRERVIADFRRGAVSLLIATNLAARGLDIPEVSHVINYDIPEESESYVHRIGRTARMGREGVAITFVAEWDEKSFAEIKKVANGALRQERLSLYA